MCNMASTMVECPQEVRGATIGAIWMTRPTWWDSAEAVVVVSAGFHLSAHRISVLVGRGDSGTDWGQEEWSWQSRKPSMRQAQELPPTGTTPRCQQQKHSSRNPHFAPAARSNQIVARSRRPQMRRMLISVLAFSPPPQGRSRAAGIVPKWSGDPQPPSHLRLRQRPVVYMLLSTLI